MSSDGSPLGATVDAGEAQENAPSSSTIHVANGGGNADGCPSSVLDKANAVTDTGVDWTLWLPDELLIAVLRLAPAPSLWSGTVSLVCRRWHAIVQCREVQAAKRSSRWWAYAKGTLGPRSLAVKPGTVQWPPESLLAVVLGPFNTVYFAAGKDILCFDQTSFEHLRTQRGHTGRVISLAVSANHSVYSSSSDHTVRVWDGEDGTLLRIITDFAASVNAVFVSPLDELYTSSTDGVIKVFAADGTPRRTLQTDTIARCFVWTPHGTVHAGCNDCTVKVWCGEFGHELRTLRGHRSAVVAIVYGGDGRIYSGGVDQLIIAWDAEDGSRLVTIVGHLSFVYALAWNPVGGLVSASTDGTIRFWRASEGTLMYKINSRSTRDSRVVFSPNGDLFSTGNQALLVW